MQHFTLDNPWMTTLLGRYLPAPFEGGEFSVSGAVVP